MDKKESVKTNDIRGFQGSDVVDCYGHSRSEKTRHIEDE